MPEAHKLKFGMALIIKQHSSIFKCVVSFIGQRYFVVTPLIKNSGLSTGDIIVCEFIDKCGIYTFKTQLIEINDRYCVLKYPEHVTRIQNREFVRAETDMPINCNGHNGKILNISSGGILLSGNLPLKLGDIVQ